MADDEIAKKIATEADSLVSAVVAQIERDEIRRFISSQQLPVPQPRRGTQHGRRRA